MSFFLSPKGRVGRLQRRALSHLCYPYSRPIARSLDSTAECPTPFREPLQFIVIAVMSVMSGTFPDTNGVFYVTINFWRVRGPSRHRHGYRYRRNALPKRLPRRRDGDDAHDDNLRAFSCGGSPHRARPGGTPHYDDQAPQPDYCRLFVRQAPSAIRSIRRSVARASPIAVWSPPGSFWFL